METIKTNQFFIVLKGTIISIIITMIMLFIFSAVLTYTNIKENIIVPVIIVTTGISILIGSSISCIKIKKNGLINGAIIGGIYMVTLYILSSILNTGFSLNFNSIIMIVIGIIAGIIGGIVGVNLK